MICYDPGVQNYVMMRVTTYPEQIMDSTKVAVSVLC